LLATVLLIVACLLLVGCADESDHGRETGSITTGSTSPAQTRSSRTTLVQPGDTLFSIARRNNVTVYDLAASNNLSSTRLRVGQTLSVPSY
jgi:LysM repeat protein